MQNNLEIEKVREALKAGQVVILPTETVYGVACLASNSDEIFKLKRRPISKQLARVYGSVEAVLAKVRADRFLEKAIRSLLPGPYTLLLTDLEGHTFGARVPDHELCLQVLEGLEEEIALTSANIHNEFPAVSYPDAHLIFPTLVGIDGGVCKYSMPSMLIDMTITR